MWVKTADMGHVWVKQVVEVKQCYNVTPGLETGNRKVASISQFKACQKGKAFSDRWSDLV